MDVAPRGFRGGVAVFLPSSPAAAVSAGLPRPSMKTVISRMTPAQRSPLPPRSSLGLLERAVAASPRRLTSRRTLEVGVETVVREGTKVSFRPGRRLAAPSPVASPGREEPVTSSISAWSRCSWRYLILLSGSASEGSRSFVKRLYSSRRYEGKTAAIDSAILPSLRSIPRYCLAVSRSLGSSWIMCSMSLRTWGFLILFRVSKGL
mmetsp:Transcript_20527/g.50376  ORF Transcript_20527/g.50376 Transcript_20527/m.50376 type:complete len:206 (+) Transcript_20527:763-1380(+)